jgi:hypothetical protein
MLITKVLLLAWSLTASSVAVPLNLTSKVVADVAVKSIPPPPEIAVKRCTQPLVRREWYVVTRDEDPFPVMLTLAFARLVGVPSPRQKGDATSMQLSVFKHNRLSFARRTPALAPDMMTLSPAISARQGLCTSV